MQISKNTIIAQHHFATSCAANLIISIFKKEITKVHTLNRAEIGQDIDLKQKTGL